MKKIIKKIAWVFFILSLFGSVIIYLSHTFLSQKIKSFVSEYLKNKIQKKVTIEAVEFNLFKGIVFKDLRLSEDAKELVYIKEVSLKVIPFSFHRGPILACITLDSPFILLERKKDGTLNLKDLFPEQKGKIKKKKGIPLLNEIIIINGRVNFQDRYLEPVFNVILENLNFKASLSWVPSKINFFLQTKILPYSGISLNANGQYDFLNNQLIAKINIPQLSPKEFSGYLKYAGIEIKDGIADIKLDLRLKENILEIDLVSQNKNLILFKDGITAKLNSFLKANLNYNFLNKKLFYHGNLDILKLDLSGIKNIDKLEGIRGQINFNQDSLKIDKLRGEFLDLKYEANLNILDFKKRILELELRADLTLETAQRILKQNFDLSLPLNLSGKAQLKMDLTMPLLNKDNYQLKGILEISKARLETKYPLGSLTNIEGKVEFQKDYISAKKLKFNWAKEDCLLDAAIKNLTQPEIDIELNSKSLSLNSQFKIKKNLINISLLNIKYFNSKAQLKGSLDISGKDFTLAKLNLIVKLNPEDLKVNFAQLKSFIEKTKLEGSILVNLDISGNLKDIKSCDIQTRIESPQISLYGLSLKDLLLFYNQSEGLADIPMIRFSFYEGMVEANAKINLNLENIPYLCNLYIQEVKLHKLKIDTPLKEKDISGIINSYIRLNGSLKYPSKLNGEGRIVINDAKLWQIDLFKGIGQLLFSPEFTEIIFDRGTSNFSIRDNFIYIDNLLLTSNLVNLTGYGKIGLDSSIEASISVQMSDEIISPLGRIKEITSAILGKIGRFAVVKITGTLKSPKYSIQPAVVDIIKGLKDLFSGQEIAR
ncbi:MAG: AsmA family protein [Candidatus Omnitrophica bacterium]|nr:AsmA family protein [Candidatus Omnitrophota bacterium]